MFSARAENSKTSWSGNIQYITIEIEETQSTVAKCNRNTNTTSTGLRIMIMIHKLSRDITTCMYPLGIYVFSCLICSIVAVSRNGAG